MNKRAILFAILAAFSAGAAAQFGGGIPGMGGRRGSRDNRDRPADGKRDAPLDKPRVDLLEVSLGEFRQDLKLRQEQEAAWQRYADSVRALAADRERESRRSPATTQATLLQRIERLADAERNRLAALEEIAERATALFNLLSPEQRTAADPRLANLVAQAAGRG